MGVKANLKLIIFYEVKEIISLVVILWVKDIIKHVSMIVCKKWCVNYVSFQYFRCSDEETTKDFINNAWVIIQSLRNSPLKVLYTKHFLNTHCPRAFWNHRTDFRRFFEFQEILRFRSHQENEQDLMLYFIDFHLLKYTIDYTYMVVTRTQNFETL